MNPERMGVIARTSSMAYKRTSKSVREIGANSASTTSSKAVCVGKTIGSGSPHS